MLACVALLVSFDPPTELQLTSYVPDLIDFYFKLCDTNMLHRKQIIHKIYNEMTDMRETRILYCQLNVLRSRL